MIRSTYRGVVYPWECDFFQHMNVQFYMAKFDAANWQFLAQIGIQPSYFKDENRALVAMEQRIRYYVALHAGDSCYVQSEILELGPKTVRIRHKMYNLQTNEVAAEAEYLSVHINAKTRKSHDFPADVSAKLSIELNNE